MPKTDEATKARLGKILQDQIGVQLDEFGPNDLDALAAACRNQFVDVGPVCRVRVGDVVGIELAPVMAEILPQERDLAIDAPTHRKVDGFLELTVSLAGGGQHVVTLEEPVALAAFRDLSGLEVDPCTRDELGLWNVKERALIRVGEAYVTAARKLLVNDDDAANAAMKSCSEHVGSFLKRFPA
jgi:hypothetical protein